MNNIIKIDFSTAATKTIRKDPYAIKVSNYFPYEMYQYLMYITRGGTQSANLDIVCPLYDNGPNPDFQIGITGKKKLGSETIQEAIKREMIEEVGLSPKKSIQNIKKYTTRDRRGNNVEYYIGYINLRDCEAVDDQNSDLRRYIQNQGDADDMTQRVGVYIFADRTSSNDARVYGDYARKNYYKEYTPLESGIVGSLIYNLNYLFGRADYRNLVRTY